MTSEWNSRNSIPDDEFLRIIMDMMGYGKGYRRIELDDEYKDGIIERARYLHERWEKANMRISYAEVLLDIAQIRILERYPDARILAHQL